MSTASNQVVQFSEKKLPTTDINQGSVEIESQRAIAEVQGKITVAMKFPRSLTQSLADLLECCRNPEFAEAALFTVPNRGTNQPSIRLAETAATCYGHMTWGHRELSRGDGKSEIEVFAWDMQKNNISSRQITVLHVIDTKNGPRKLTDQADIDNKIANVASKQMRGRLFAVIPAHFRFAAIAEVKKTLAGLNDEPLLDRISKMVKAFERFKISKDRIEKYLEHPIDATTGEEIQELLGVFNALKEGGIVTDYFPVDENAIETSEIKKALPTAAAVDTTTTTVQQQPAAANTQTDTQQPAATQQSTRTRRTKEQIAADEAAKLAAESATKAASEKSQAAELPSAKTGPSAADWGDDSAEEQPEYAGTDADPVAEEGDDEDGDVF